MRKQAGGHKRAASARLYALLLAAYPAKFRREYGREMRVVFADRCREARGVGGVAARARVWREAVVDLARTAPRERLEDLLGGGRLMKLFRTVVLAALAYAFTLLVVAPLYARHAGSMPGFVANLLDALIFTGLVFNFIYLVLTLTRWLEGVRAVRAALALTTGVVGTLITVMLVSLGREARFNLWIAIAQVLGLLIWFTIHLWWVLRKKASAPPTAA
jgi:hypothetical protein